MNLKTLNAQYMIVISIITQDTVIIMTHRPIVVQVMRLLGDFQISIKKKNSKKSNLLSDEVCFSHTRLLLEQPKCICMCYVGITLKCQHVTIFDL